MSDINKLIKLLSRLPGLGIRSSRRMALHMIKHRDDIMVPMQNTIADVVKNVKTCVLCNNLDIIDPCKICSDQDRPNDVLCVVEDVIDLWAIERSKLVNYKYYILGGALSAIDGIGPNQLKIPELVKRVEDENISEVILATNTTVEGQTTAHYIYNLLHEMVKISLPAQGIPIGGELDYLDETTLHAALNDRKAFLTE